MKALILVGGYGTRLRPLTLTMPKPLIPFANKPMVLHQIESLVSVGIKEIIFAVNYGAEQLKKEVGKYKEKFSIDITFSVETEPLGTGGPIALAKNILLEGGAPFFVLNSDVICNYPLSEMISFHKKHGKEGTVLVTEVEEPSKYGVVVCEKNSTQIEKFVEKPKNFISNKINAGIYLFNSEVLKRFEIRPTSIEKEIFPQMAQEKNLHSIVLKDFWMDVGQPKDYLKAIALYFENKKKRQNIPVSNIQNVKEESENKIKSFEDSLIDPTASIGVGCEIGPNVFIGKNVKIGNGVCLKNCSIFENASIGKNSYICSTIVGWNSKIGDWTRLEGVGVLGQDVSVNDFIYMNGVIVLPNKTIEDNISIPQIII